MVIKARIQIPKTPTKQQVRTHLVNLARKSAELNKDMIEKSIDRGKDIITGGNFANIKDSTKNIRRMRGFSGTKPLVETGELRDSIEVKNTPDGANVVLGVPYGWVHNETPNPEPIVENAFSKKFNTVGKPVPRRRFFGTPVAFFRRKEFKKIQREANETLGIELSKSKTVTIN